MEIAGIGTAVPPHRVSQDDASAMTAELVCENPRQARLVRAMFRGTAIETRHTCVPYRSAYEWARRDPAVGATTSERLGLYREHAGPLATRAARRAIEAGAVDPKRVSHLVTVSCTGFHAPGVDLELIDALGLPASVERVHVGFMGCHGAINAFRVAHGMIAAARAEDATVLVCAVELCSLHFRFGWDPERVLGNALFADGAAALIARAPRADAVERDWRLQATASCILPASRDAMGWAIGDHGFEMHLTGRIAAAIEEALEPWLAAWLDAQGLSIRAVRSWAIHPGGPRILDAARHALGLPREAVGSSDEILAAYGNMSSPTVLFILDRLRARGAPLPCVALAFGPGLTAEAALFV